MENTHPLPGEIPALKQTLGNKNVHAKPWARWLLPSFADFLFVAMFVWLFATGAGGWYGLLSDGDTGWHIRTGEWILQHGAVPQTDLFSFSKSGQPWFAWEWLSEILFAGLHQAAGLKGVLLYSAVVICGFGVVLFRHMIWKGAVPAAVLVVTLLTVGASSIHYLARPHVHTLLFLAISLWVIDRDRHRPDRAIWLLVPFTVFWVNIHGGFLALIACLGLLVAGTLAEQVIAPAIEGRRGDWHPVRRYALLGALCGLMSLVNPYGWKLHQHVFAYLRSDWIKNNIEEFQSPRFRDETILQFEILLLLGVMTALWLIRRREVTPALWILFWAHSALGSVRHVPLYMIVAAPWVAMGLTELWRRFMEGAPKKSVRAIFSDMSRDCLPGCRRMSIWVGVLVAGFALSGEPLVRWPKDFPKEKFPLEMIARHQETLISGRLFTSDEWADYLIYRLYPRQKTFVDGRSDFFGKEIGDDYLRILKGHWKWESVMAKYRFDTALVPVEWPVATLLKANPAWKLVEDGGKTLLFVRKHPYTNGSQASRKRPI
ncbi:MAG: hypothetical protein SFV51_04205 [Bryobacteraceae bacterium]|nr:hypothetical protein [Bryobacteraceae bacterium]